MFSVISNLYDSGLTFTNDGEDFVSNSDTGCPLGYFEYLYLFKLIEILYIVCDFF